MKSLEIVDSHIKSIVDYLDNPQVKEDIDCLNIMCVGVSYKELQQIKQDLEVLETLLDNCENRFLSVLHECLIRGTPIHTEDIQRLSGYINKILTIKKQWLEVNENELGN